MSETTAEERAHWALGHKFNGTLSGGRPMCGSCGQPDPCPVARLLADLEATEERAQKAEARLAAIQLELQEAIKCYEVEKDQSTCRDWKIHMSGAVDGLSWLADGIKRGEV